MNSSSPTPVVGSRLIPAQTVPADSGVREAPVKPASTSAEAPHLGFRPDIEGLRAVAVTLVVLSHAGIGLFAGGYVGVDVFFVISGFLITSLLLREVNKRGTISLRGFYARRALRLLPVSVVVLLATLAASWLWLPSTRFKSISLDALFSTFYGINWRLAYEGTDYLNATAAPSPLQHLWSLAVEEQFYLVWPVLLLVVWSGRRASRRALIALSVLVVGTLVVSVLQTTSAAPWAYFGSHTRAWELGIGALVAIGAGVLARTPKALAAVLTWGGLAAVIASSVLFDESTAFPGYVALLPVLGTAAVIAGGSSAAGWGAGSLIGTAPFRFVGKLSYGWYLWHWPVLMIWPAAFVRNPSIKSNLVFAAGALGLAFITYHLVENPVRTQRWLRARARRGLSLGLVLSASAAALALFIGQFTPPLPTGPAAPDTAAELAAAADPQARLTELITKSVGTAKLPKNLTPKVEEAGAQSPQIYEDQCHFNYTQVKQDRPCVYGDPNGAKTVYLVGDSHAAHWFPAFDDLARDRGWKLVALTKAACQLPEVLNWNPALKRPYNECVTWREQIVGRIVADRPDLVVMASNDLDNGGIIDENGQQVPREGLADDPVWVQAWQRTWAKLKGIPLVLLQDSAWPQDNAPECAAVNARELNKKCVRRPAWAIAEPNRRMLVAAAARTAGIKVIDPTPWFCAEKCPIVVGNILVYKDDSHMTLAYARALEPLIGRAVFGP
jgi:peptidoglycan/LPS O-acetylase OafA/YrhL